MNVFPCLYHTYRRRKNVINYVELSFSTLFTEFYESFAVEGRFLESNFEVRVMFSIVIKGRERKRLLRTLLNLRVFNAFIYHFVTYYYITYGVKMRD